MRVDRRGALGVAVLCAVVPAAAVFSAVQPATAAPRPVVIVVAPNGNDHNAGTAKAPLKTVAAAQRRARTVVKNRDVTVQLGTGTYDLSAPLVLTAQDAGRPAHPVTWTAAPGAHPVVSGGSAVKGWHRVDAAANIYSAPVARGWTAGSSTATGPRSPGRPSRSRAATSRSPTPG